MDYAESDHAITKIDGGVEWNAESEPVHTESEWSLSGVRTSLGRDD